MEEKLKEAFEKAGVTEEELTNGESKAAKAMEDKAEVAAASKVEETVVVDNMERKDIKTKVITVLKWTGYFISCFAIGYAIGTLIKGGAAEVAETAAEATE